MFPSSYFDNPMLTTAMETHIKSIKEARFPFLDIWDESMTSTSLPNYQRNSLFQLLSNLLVSPSLSPTVQAKPFQNAPSQFRARLQAPGQNTADTS